jgi:signal transduction histidine kinase
MLHRLTVRLPRLSLVIGLLVLTLGVASALAWQAHVAARSHHDAAERVLRDYAGVAGWEFARATRREMDAALDRWLDVIGCAATSGPLPQPDGLATREGCKCDDLVPLSLFAADLRTGAIETTGFPIGEHARAWIRRGAERPVAPAVHQHGRTLRIDVVDGRVQVLAGRIAVDRGTPIAFAGFIAEPSALGSTFTRVIANHPLLPPTLAGGGNEMLGIAVATRGGVPIFSTGTLDGAVPVTGVLDESLGALAYEISLKPEAAERLVIGGLPRSRLPLLLGLLGLTAGLLIVAVLQLRREHELAGLRADFVSSVSHELRTPLAQIRLFSETLLLGRVRSEAEGRRSLEIIQQEARRLSHLVENVLYFSRTERGALRVTPVPMRLADVAAEVVETFQPLARSARASVRLDITHDVVAPVDAWALRQILLNLLDNAAKYGRAGQTIVVVIAERDGRAAVVVEDEGPGVPIDARDLIWRPYTRLASAATSAVAGTGIGLAVVRDLAALHGGDARVEEAPGGGARFVVTFPGARPAAEAAAVPGRASVPA